jgi:hypothetical protein
MTPLFKFWSSQNKEYYHTRHFRNLHLKVGETIIVWAIGYIGKIGGCCSWHNGVLVVTNERAVFFRKRIIGKILIEIPLDEITRVDRIPRFGLTRINVYNGKKVFEFKHAYSEANEIKLVAAMTPLKPMGIK